MSEELKREMEIGLSLSLDDPRLKKMLKSYRAHSFADTNELLSQVSAFYQENAPDLVLYDRYHLPGRILAKRFGISAVQVTANFAYYNGLACRRNGVFQNPDILFEHSNEQDAFLSTHGISAPGSYWHVEDLNIHFLPREFQCHADWFDERFCFTGALLNRPFRPTWTNRSNGRPIILVSGMSLWSDTKIDYGQYFGMFVDALSELPVHCVLSIGDDEFSRTLPSNCELNRRASHLEILPHAALSICHGGMTSTLEAIYHGVPVLMIPLTEDCDEVAYRAEELGLGTRRSIDAQSTEELGNVVREMLRNVSLQNRVKDMQEVFRRSGGAELGADRIGAHLQAIAWL